MQPLSFFRAAVATAVLLAAPLATQAAPTVVASIAPVHSIVARVMQDVDVPRLLVAPGASPHTYAMRPSDARALDEADAVFWIGPSLETFLVRPLAALAGDARVVALITAPGVATLPFGEDHDEDHGHDAGHRREPGHDHDHDHGHEHGPIDPHVWLDPDNAVAMAQAIAAALAAIDPPNAERYRANAEAFDTEIVRLNAEVAATTTGARSRPAVVFHDAYGYFARRFGPDIVGVITINPETPPSARRLRDIETRIAETGAACIFVEPQFDARLARSIADGAGLQAVRLDPLGANLDPGPDLYPRLIRDMAAAVRACISG